MIEKYREEADKRAEQNLPPLPLTPDQVKGLVLLLEQDHEETSYMLELLNNRVEPGVSKSDFDVLWVQQNCTIRPHRR